jgi:ribosomal protein S27AE
MTVRDVPKYKFVDRLRPPCSRCGRLLLLARIEPQELSFDLRT